MKKILLLLILVSSQLMAQDLKQAALDNYNNQKWEAAAKNYLKYLKKNDGDSSDWYNLAISKSRLEEYNDAVKYFEEAKSRNYNKQFIYVGISKAYAAAKDEANMMSTLKKGSEDGLVTYAILTSDPAFASYQQSAEFKSILKKVELNAYPCLSDENCRHFDFWLGEWDVYVNGNKVGENSITMAKGGCAIHENYTTSRNYAGQSINFYDRVDEKWHQHWVGTGTDIYNYVETDRGPGMLEFLSKYRNGQGGISLSKLTFTLNEDGTVRQFFENSNDEGKTWTPAFDGLYKRKTD